MPFARLKEAFFTLRFRLILWVTVLVFVLVTLSMVAIGLVVRRSLLSEFDNLLRKDLQDVRQILKDHPQSPPQLFARLQQWVEDNDQVGFVQLYQADGHLLWQSPDAPRLPAVAPDLEQPEYKDHAKLRFVEGRDPSTSWLIRAGLSRASLDEDVALLNRIMILSSVVILVLTPLAGFFLAGRATRPLQWIISTTARLQPQRLQERLPVRGSSDELDQLSATINGMLDRIGSYIQRNREFIASAAHELRSPLAAIRSSVEVALNRPRSNDEYAELLEEVMEECTRLGTLVDRLLLLAEGDAGQISAGQNLARLDKILRESVDMFQGVAEEQEVPLILGPMTPVQVRGDEYHLRQIVRNLIDNALKFTAPPGQVRVELEAQPQRKRVLFRVIDQGSGIAAADLPHIFERFYRADKSRQRMSGKTGIGLGLSICRTLVQALQGEIRVDSEVGQGSTFTVELPAAE
jgi:heavy metal sensor kinase